MGLAKRFFTVSGLTVVSRIFGIAREAILVHFLGASIEMDAFTTAFKFPCFFRRFFAEGGFQSIFVPYFTDFIITKKRNGAKYFSSRIFSMIFWIMLILSVVVFIFARQFTILMAPGFVNTPERLVLATEFTRIIFPSVAFVSLSTVYSGILISRKKFFAYSLVPVLINFILIGSLLICRDVISAGRRISYGVLISGIFQFVYMYACVKYAKLPGPKISSIKPSAKVKSFIKKLMPVLAGAGISQVNVLMGSLFASFLPTGCITYLYCADRFVQLPLALFGISMGLVLLPEISEAVAKKRFEDMKRIQSRSILFAIRLALPSVVALVMLSYYMISILYGHGKFSSDAVISTSKVLKFAVIGLPAYVISKIIASVLFAQKDSKTPMRAAIISMISNIVLSIILMIPFKEIGIALANSISGFINAYVMCRKTDGWFSLDKTGRVAIIKIAAAVCVMLFAMIGLELCVDTSSLNTIEEIIMVAVSCSLGGIAYSIALYLFRDTAAISCVKMVMDKLHI